ncbi:MAG TPA: hypothetical protein VFS32_07065 [Candidatus Limnocylindrales bacterium]|nr:hypothetical protein [Candidatus Limnocylindrales bacterium]
MTWPDDPGDEVVAPYDYQPEPPPERPRRIVTPTRVTLLVAILGSIAYFAYAITVRESQQIPLLASGAAVLGLVFLALAMAGGLATFQAGRDGRVGRALGMAIAGGLAGLLAAGAFAAALVLALAYRA